MKHTITLTVDDQGLTSYTDQHLAALWHAAQANPADAMDRDAGDIAERIGREIIRRFLVATPPELYAHQAHHYYWNVLVNHGSWDASGQYRLKPTATEQGAPACLGK